MPLVRRIALGLLAGLICAIALAGAGAWHGGYRLYIVRTGSMAPALQAGDVVLDGPAKDSYRPGEIVTFRHSDRTADLVTHRITDLRGGKIHTKGDANRTADVWDIRPDQVRGVVAQRLPRLGYLFVFLRQPTGLASVATGGLALVLIWGMLNPDTVKEDEPESAGKPEVTVPAP